MLDQRRVAAQPEENCEHSFREQMFTDRYANLRVWAMYLTHHDSTADDLVHDLYVQWMLSRTRLEEIENIDGLFSADAEIGIYRIAQESLNNLVKHSRASTARFEVCKEDGVLRMTVEDNGVGFNYDAAINGSSSGFGLANLRERVRLLGGSLKIETAPGKGTGLAIDIPAKP